MIETENTADLSLSFSETLTLSERDFLQFIARLENPLPPTPELREYQQLKAAYPEANL